MSLSNIRQLFGQMYNLTINSMNNITGKLIILGMIVFFSFNPESLAHGINFETSQEPPVVTVKAFFSRTAPLVNAVVDIYAPDDDQPYQRGRTDKAGYFAFMPDRTGEWTMRVDDERGHVDRVAISVSGIFFNEEQVASDETFTEETKDPLTEIEGTDTEKDFPVFYSVITGIALIFGLTGTIYGIKARQALHNKS